MDMFTLRILASLSLMVTSIQAECGNKPADIIFLMDASSSIWEPNFRKQVRFVRTLVEEFDISPTITRCGALTFSDQVHEEFNFSTYLSKSPLLRDGLGFVSQLLGGTRTDLALKRMREMFLNEPRPGVPKIAVVLTDGESEEPELTREQALLAHKEGITVFAIGIGRKVLRSELVTLASKEDYVFEVDTHDALKAIKGMLVTKTCTVQIPEEPPEIDCGSRPSDVVFVLDASGSIWGQDFQRQLTFVQDLVDDFDVSPSSTRVAALTFGTEPQKQFHLDTFGSATDVKDAIGLIKQSRGSTNTADALRRARTHFFGKHTREGVVQIAIVITDGSSNDPRATAHQAALTREEGVHIFAVGVGQDVDPDELEAIASRPQNQYVFNVEDFMGLQRIKNLLAKRTCEVTAPPPTTTSTIPTTLPTTTTTTTTTTKKQPPMAEAMMSDQAYCTFTPTDIIFALPGDTDPSKATQALTFMRAISMQLGVSEHGVHVGLLPKDCNSVPGFHLSQGHDKVTVTNKLDSTHFSTSDTETQLKLMYKEAFSVKNGGREGAKRIGILIIDKDSYQRSETVYESWNAREVENIELFVIGVGDSVSNEELRAISSEPHNSHIYRVKEYCDLIMMAESVAKRIQQVCSPSQ